MNTFAGEKVLRVGIAWQDGIFMRNADGSYSGYMVEYFAKLAQYANWQYEFVPSDPFSSSLMLQNGEVDLGCYILKTPEREKLYDFPVQSSGVLPLSVVARADNEQLKNSSPFRWRNLKVAFWGKSEPTRVSFEIFVKNNNITYTSKNFEHYEEAIAAVQSGKADVFVHRVVDIPADLCVVRQFDHKPFFTACGKNNPELLKQLEAATQALKLNEQTFLDDLSRKYFKTVKLPEYNRKRV
ncbi:MAG: transporter substrate-binding domain-containing protein, partial [Victivallaceae bacterium]